MRFTSSENTQLGIRFLGFSVDIYAHACRHLVEFISRSKCLSSSSFLAESVLAHGAVINQRSHFSDGAAGSSAKHKLKFALKKKTQRRRRLHAGIRINFQLRPWSLDPPLGRLTWRRRFQSRAEMIQRNYRITSRPLLTGGSLRSQEGKLCVCQHPVMWRLHRLHIQSEVWMPTRCRWDETALTPTQRPNEAARHLYHPTEYWWASVSKPFSADSVQEFTTFLRVTSFLRRTCRPGVHDTMFP